MYSDNSKTQSSIPTKKKPTAYLSRREKALKKRSKKQGRPKRHQSKFKTHEVTGSINELHPINNAPIQTRVLRYLGTITSSTDFRVTDMTKLLLAVTSGSTSAIRLFEAVKIQKIVITCLPSSDTNSGTFSFTWSGEREPDVVYTMFYAQGAPSRWSFIPPEDSLAGFWITQDTNETSNSIFTLDPDNSTVKLVLDLHFQYVVADGASATVTLTGAATFTGVAALVMPSAATDELVPVGINSVTA